MKFSGHGKPDLPAGIPESGPDSHSAVSEIIGSLMMITIVVVAVSIIGVALWSQPTPEKIPSLSAFITNQRCTLFVNHEGGDLLERQSFQILVDGTDQTASFSKRGTSSAWTSWGIGDTLTYTPISCPPMPQSVQIIYSGGNGALVLSSANFGKGIFSDNFEEGNYNGWAATGNVAMTSSPADGSYAVWLRNTGSIQQTIPTTGYSDITVAFRMGANSIEAGEYVAAEWSPDGTTWTILKQINNGDSEEDNALHSFSYSLPANAGNNANFALRFRIAGNANNDEGFVDTVLVEGIPG